MTNILIKTGCIGLMSMMLFGTFSLSAQAKPWDKMHAGANPPTVSAARDQCLRAKVPRTECQQFADMLQADACSPITVPDGVKYRWIGGPRNSIARNITKKLGGGTMALVCTLPSGRVLHWYAERVTGREACNNAGEPAAKTTTVFDRGPIEMLNGPRISVVPTIGAIDILGCCCEPSQQQIVPSTGVIIQFNSH